MKNGFRTTLLLLGDIVVLLGAFWIMLHTSFYGRLNESIIKLHVLPFLILGTIWILIFFIFNLYNVQATKPTIPHLRIIFIAFIVAFISGVIFFYSIPSFGITPKTNLLIFTIAGIILFILWRRIFYTIFSSYLRRNLVFIVDSKETNKQLKDLVEYIEKYPQSGFIVIGVHESMHEFSQGNKDKVPDVFIVSKEIWKNAENFKKLYEIQSEILDLAYAYEDVLGRIPIEAIDEGWFMHNIRSHRKKIYDFEKRISGIITAILVVIITSPITIIIAFLIKISDYGPIFYSQTRIGKNGRRFRLYKFRSMIVDAEKNGAEWSGKNDPRVTKIGRILRKIHVDEIPQMLNVLRGDIALVGPRPERPEFVEDLKNKIPFYHLRQIITPGFTGWAQIKFRYARSVMDSKEKFEYDLYYMKKRNIFMDLGIILRTIQIIFTHS